MSRHVKFSKDIINRLGSYEYWKSLNPDLTISDRPFLRPAPQLSTESMDTDSYVRQMKQEGYFKLDAVLPRDDMERMATAVINLVDKGFPPVFVYVYDEFLQVFKHLSPILTPIFGEKYRMVTNFWAWHIPAAAKGAGFAPHRDLTGKTLMRPDGMPGMATVWVPLKDVTTLNACMYVLPTDQDPNVPDNMADITIPPESIQSIRALPGKAGSVMCWNQSVLHWGSNSSEWADDARISIAAYLQRADEPGLTNISLEPLQQVTLDFRLGVIGMLMSHYDQADISKDRYPPQLMEFCKKYLNCEPDERRSPQPQQGLVGTPVVAKVGRNDPCPCGSGKKYKRCHGAVG